VFKFREFLSCYSQKIDKIIKIELTDPVLIYELIPGFLQVIRIIHIIIVSVDSPVQKCYFAYVVHTVGEARIKGFTCTGNFAVIVVIGNPYVLNLLHIEYHLSCNNAIRFKRQEPFQLSPEWVRFCNTEKF